MANTYTQIHLHVVFAVQGRARLIPTAHADELYKFITGIITKRGQKLLAINGMPDHIHLLIGLRPDIALSDLVRDIKAGSSKFISEQGWLRAKFTWQEGFGAFSYAVSQLSNVIQYIENQQQHHSRKSFPDEYRIMLDKFGVTYDERYLFTDAYTPDDSETSE